MSKLGQRDPAYISEFELDGNRSNPGNKTSNSLKNSIIIQEDTHPINVIGQ